MEQEMHNGLVIFVGQLTGWISKTHPTAFSTNISTIFHTISSIIMLCRVSPVSIRWRNVTSSIRKYSTQYLLCLNKHTSNIYKIFYNRSYPKINKENLKKLSILLKTSITKRKLGILPREKVQSLRLYYAYMDKFIM